MPIAESLSEREFRVLEAVIQTYIVTAEPAGSQTIAKRFGLGVSPATIRSTMSDLEEKGYLFHPHTSAGRIPTDRAYRWYVDNLLQHAPPSDREQETLRSELPGSHSPVEEILRRAAQLLGVLTQELGVAVAPTLRTLLLERLELIQVATDRLLLVLKLRSGVVRTIFMQVPGTMPDEVVQRVAQTLNERLAGLTLEEIGGSLAERLRDAEEAQPGRDLVNIFIAEGEEFFALPTAPQEVVLGSSEMLAGQPEFAADGKIRDLLQITERRDLLRQALDVRRQQGLTVTIGAEHTDPRLGEFTLVTSRYRAGELSGVIGVLGPTRMPYDKIVGLVDHTSRLVEGLLE